MRLIDADELKQKKVYSHERHENIVAVAEIDWMPTIDAIPVDWLEERLRKEIDAAVLGTGTRAGKAIAYSVFNVLELWKADKRRREAKA